MIRTGRRVLRGAVIAVAVLLSSAVDAFALTGTPFTEGISTPSYPYGITPGPDGNVWFTELTGDRIGRITPAGAITEFSAGISANSAPRGIAAGPDGNIWFTENNGNRVGRITPAGVITEFSADISPNSGPGGITAGADGNLWFTESNGNRIARVTTAGAVTEFAAGMPELGESPGDIVTQPDGTLWFGTSSGVARTNTDVNGVTPFSTAPAPVIGVARGSDGQVWFTTPHTVGRTTSFGTVIQFTTGIAPGSLLQGIAAGPDGNMWFTGFTDQGKPRLWRITPAGAVTEFTAGLPADAGVSHLTTGPDGNLWLTFYADQPGVLRVTVDPPAVTIGDARGVTLTEATVTASLDPRSDPTTYHFQYGATTSYGSQTATQTVSAAAAAGEVSAALTGLAAETVYHYRLVATNGGGQTSFSDDRTFTTPANLDRDGDGSRRPDDCDDGNAAIHPGAIDTLDNDTDEDCDGIKAVNLDRDADGSRRPEDCDDTNPAIHRGVPERRGNAIDENCDGVRLPYLRITSGIQRLFVPSGRYWITRKLVVRDAPVGSTAEVRCRGRGCPRKAKRLRSKGAKELRFTSYLAGRRLRPGVVVEVRITMPDQIGKLARYEIRRGRAPKATVLCLPPGESKPSECPQGS